MEEKLKKVTKATNDKVQARRLAELEQKVSNLEKAVHILTQGLQSTIMQVGFSSNAQKVNLQSRVREALNLVAPTTTTGKTSG